MAWIKTLDQSQINILLIRMDNDSMKQFKDIHYKILIDNSSSITSTKMIVVDIDQLGLIANGKTYGLADKGYFAKKKNKRGYQLSTIFAGGTPETIAMKFDSSNTHSIEAFSKMFKNV